jgi:hypothetical protein
MKYALSKLYEAFWAKLCWLGPKRTISYHLGQSVTRSVIGVKYCLLDSPFLMVVRLLAALITNILYSF